MVSASSSCPLEGLHERSLADLHVEEDRSGSRRDLLRHDARRDQRDLLDGRGHVAQRVEAPVGGYEVRRLADDRQADVSDLTDERLGLQLDREAGNRLELVQRPARVPEPSTAHLRERDAARGDHGAEGYGRLVADPAGRVLVHADSADGREIDDRAALHHCVRERVGLGRREAPEEHGHREGGHLLVGHLAAGVAKDELSELAVVELGTVSLSFDQLDRAGHRRAPGPGSPGLTARRTAARRRDGRRTCRPASG